MRAALLSVVAVSLLTFACGGNEPPPANPSVASADVKAAGHEKGEHEKGEHEKGEHEKGEHGAMSPALHDFHEVLAPVWHSTAGTERVGKACTGQADMKAKAAAVGDAELQTDVDAVKAACDKPDHADVEAKLSVVHDRFHKLIEAKH